MELIFECKIKGVLNTGKKESVNYLVLGNSVSEVEKKIFEEPLFSSRYTLYSIESVTKRPFTDILYGEGDKYHKLRAKFEYFDEDKGRSSVKTFNYLVRSNDILGSVNLFKKQMSDTISDYEIVGITELNVEDLL